MVTDNRQTQVSGDAGEGTQITGYIGGQPKQRYWTPDGRLILAMPDIHGYGYTDKNGQIVEKGQKDANLDRGWLLQPPTNPKLSCPHCDLWHDTKEEIFQCQKKKKAFDARWQRRAKKDNSVAENAQVNSRIDKLENDLFDIKELLQKLVKAE